MVSILAKENNYAKWEYDDIAPYSFVNNETFQQYASFLSMQQTKFRSKRCNYEINYQRK